MHSNMNKMATMSSTVGLLLLIVAATAVVSAASHQKFRRQVIEDNAEQMPGKVNTLWSAIIIAKNICW